MKRFPAISVAALCFASLCGAQTVNQTTATFLGEGGFPQAFPGSVSTDVSVAAAIAEAPAKSGPQGNLVAGRRSSVTGLTIQAVPLINPDPATKNIVGPEPAFFGFTGLTHFDQRNAYFGTNFSLEPPDQALAVANGFVFEGVNEAFAVYDTSGNRLAGPLSVNQFFQQFPAIIRLAAGNQFGPSFSDPRIYFDRQTQRWFVTVLEEDTVNTTGAVTGRTRVFIAVSKTASPMGAYNFYTIETSDDGSRGTPAHAGCPCLPDQPLIGADAYGFYITTNEFSLGGPGFNGAQIYAVAKIFLTTGAPNPVVVHISGIPLAEGVAYTVQPAVSNDFAGEPVAGVEYFLSALDFTGTLDNRIAVWALQNTFSLGQAIPSVTLTHKILKSEVYGQPPPAVQPPGPTPLGTANNDPLERVNTNDDRMNQVVFANGRLYAGLNTIVGGLTYSNHTTTFARSGVAYFVVVPSVSGGLLQATMANQGYVAAPGQDSVMFPSIGINQAGIGAMTFTLVGPTTTPAFSVTPGFYPSMAFTRVSATGGTGVIQVGGAGAAPEDGFTGYPQFGGNGVARWGDYSAAVADTDGSIWMAAEYIPSTATFPRTTLANWGTYIGKLIP